MNADQLKWGACEDICQLKCVSASMAYAVGHVQREFARGGGEPLERERHVMISLTYVPYARSVCEKSGREQVGLATVDPRDLLKARDDAVEHIEAFGGHT
jgi:hypothetical protein